MRPSVQDIRKIWSWTRKDVEDLMKSFYIHLNSGDGGCGPTNAYAIYLFCMMDLWGAIFLDQFGDKNTSNNVKEFLKRLKKDYPEHYDYSKMDLDKISDKLRNNLIHYYGLKVLKTGNVEEWLEIIVNGVGPIIFLNGSKRIQIDCFRLKAHILEIIKGWLKTNNYI